MAAIVRGLLAVAFALGLVLGPLALARATSSAPAEGDFAAVDAYLEKQMADQRIPGIALGIVHGDQVAHLRGFGVADPAGRPVTPQTPFIIGSASKSITALAAMQLAEAGKLDLDAPVQTYLPWFRVADPDASARITVRHLLNQTSGLSTYVGRADSASRDTSDGALEAKVRRLSGSTLVHPVGAVWEYSNANYAVLGLLVQVVSGQSYESYVQQHVFDPLRMRNSYTSQGEAISGGLATGCQRWLGFSVPAPGVPFPRADVPAGLLIASAEDLTHYLAAQLGGGRYLDAVVLSPAGIAALQSPAVQTVGHGPAGEAYGMGWYVGQAGGGPVIWHDGDTPTFHATLVMIPGGRWGVVILANTSSFVFNLSQIDMALDAANLVAGLDAPGSSFGAVTPRIMAFMFTPAATLLIGLVFSGRALVRRRRRLEPRPVSWRALLTRVGAPLLLDVAVAVLALVIVPGFFGADLGIALASAPDIAWLLLIAPAALALAWGALRTWLTLFPKSPPG